MYELFGNAAFRKMASDGRRRPINKAIYEMWCKAIFDLDSPKRKELKEKKEQLKINYIKLCERNDFLAYVRASDKYSYNKRMNQMKNLIEGVLDD